MDLVIEALNHYLLEGAEVPDTPGDVAGRPGADRLKQVGNGGLEMRLGADLRVSRQFRHHVMPADADGCPSFQVVPPSAALMQALGAWTRGDEEEAATNLLRAFFGAHWGHEWRPAEVGEIDMCQLRSTVAGNASPQAWSGRPTPPATP